MLNWFQMSNLLGEAESFTLDCEVVLVAKGFFGTLVCGHLDLMDVVLYIAVVACLPG
jgi:hypothetical protein